MNDRVLGRLALVGLYLASWCCGWLGLTVIDDGGAWVIDGSGLLLLWIGLAIAAGYYSSDLWHGRVSLRR